MSSETYNIMIHCQFIKKQKKNSEGRIEIAIFVYLIKFFTFILFLVNLKIVNLLNMFLEIYFM